MSLIFGKEGHLTHTAQMLLKSRSLSEIELLKVLDHISECKSCADIFACSFDENQLAVVPSGFSEEVELKIAEKSPDKKQFVFYSMRVTIAACAALAIVFFGSANFVTKINTAGKSMKSPDLSFVNSINTGLKDFSQKIISMEVFQNEKEKK